MTRFPKVLILFFLVPGGCTPYDYPEHSARSTPAAYIPPPENAGPPPTDGFWIGPGGYESAPSPNR